MSCRAVRATASSFALRPAAATVPIALVALVLSGTLLPPLGAQDWVVAGPKQLIAAARPLCAARAAQGLAVSTVELGNGTADEVRRRLRAAVHAKIAAAAAPGYLLLLGDSKDGGMPTPSWQRPGLPTLVDHMPGQATVWSDLGYVDPDDDGRPEWACGRIPAADAAALSAVVHKILSYEQGEPPSDPGDEWSRTIGMIGSAGNFGPVIDTVLEGAIGKLFSEELDARFRIEPLLTLPNSPFWVEDAKFGDAVVRLLNSGPFATIYMGHGSVGRFANVGLVHPVLRNVDAPKLVSASRTILMAYACHIGSFPRHCLGEVLLAEPGGPVAVFAASETSFPFGDLLLGRELMHALQTRARGVRLGDLIRTAKARVLAPDMGEPFQRNAATVARVLGLDEDKQRALRRYTSDVYHLLGDPALQTRLPRAIDVALVGDAVRGSDLEIECRRPSDGSVMSVVAELCVDRGQVAPERGRPTDATVDSGGPDVLLRQTADWSADAATLRVRFPGELVDARYLSVRVFGTDGHDAFAGGLRFRTRR